MKRPIKIIIPDAGPINTLIAADVLDLLLLPKNTQIVIIESVLNEIISQAPKFKTFREKNADRIDVVSTSICKDDKAKLARGESIGRGRGDLAIADFIMNSIDDVVGNAPALVIYEDKGIGRLRLIGDYSADTHFITTAAYIRKLEKEGMIESFSNLWELIVSKNHSTNKELDRSPNPQEAEQEADGGSSIPLSHAHPS